jgi:hypothetical protein
MRVQTQVTNMPYSDAGLVVNQNVNHSQGGVGFGSIGSNFSNNGQNAYHHISKNSSKLSGIQINSS